jgi:tRNA wybutosine-synthesizing protein 2
MQFKQLLTEKLKQEKILLDYNLLPKGYQKIGDIIILNLNQELKPFENQIGKNTLEITKARTICNKQGKITGDLRKPQIKVIAGDKNTETCHFENKVYFCFDASKIMFAKGNVAERGRLPKQVKQNEIIVDMFVGIGYFSVPIAKIAKPKRIYAIDLNPDSIKYLKKTIEKNKLKNIELIQGDSNEIINQLKNKGIKADRVILGYLPPPKEFINSALSIIKKQGIIHYDDLIRVDYIDEDIKKTLELFNEKAEKFNLKVKLINAQKVKSYKPKVDHYVLDLKVVKSILTLSIYSI